MNALLSDLKRLTSKSLWAILDDKFRDFSMMSASSFALDEFDCKEQRTLIKLLRALERWGYFRLLSRLVSSELGKGILDMAAGYGEFVKTEGCFSYLGVFIAAEAIQYPFAMDSYAISMIRSECFRKLGSEEKVEILSLMYLARFVRDVDLPNELDLDMFVARVS